MRRLQILINLLFPKTNLLTVKKHLLLLTILCATIYSASAQYYNNTNNNALAPKLGIGVSSGLTVGAFSGAYPDAGAVSLNFELPIKKSQISLLLTTGYDFYVSQGGYSVGYDGYGLGVSSFSYGSVASFIPIEAGLKINLPHKFFIEGYVGASFNVNTYSSYYTGRETALIYSPGAGYTFPMSYNGKSNLDLSLLYENRPEPGGGYSQVALKALWNFSL
ncbi:MAG: hypothetical protein JWQ63_4204 [Mucilaginibacter sp.]|nr:hypothetical protein [Mucilaginibacter sp.]